MQCPSCNSEIHEKRVGTGRAGICGSCDGVWIPFGSMESVVPRVGELIPDRPGNTVPDIAPQTKLKCPECGGDLVQVKSNEIRGAAVKTCLVCFGRWIEGAELRGMKGRGLFARIFDFFKSKNRPVNIDASEHAPVTGSGVPAEESARIEPPEESHSQEDRNGSQ